MEKDLDSRIAEAKLCGSQHFGDSSPSWHILALWPYAATEFDEDIKEIQRATHLVAVSGRIRIVSETKLLYQTKHSEFASCFLTPSPWRLNGWGCLHFFATLGTLQKDRRPAAVCVVESVTVEECRLTIYQSSR